MRFSPIFHLLLALALTFALAPDARAAPQKDLDRLVERLRGDDIGDTVAAAQSLGEMGAKAAKAAPALIVTLDSEHPFVVDACVDALVAIGSKAQSPLERALRSGEVDGASVPRGPVARALVRMNKKGEKAVDSYVRGADPGPELYALLESMGTEGAPYIVRAAASKGDRALVVRALRRLASREPREPETIEDDLSKIKDDDLRAALALAWTQSPKSKDVDALRAWVRGDRIELVETGLWAIGLLGDAAQSAAVDVRAHFAHVDPTVRATALWAIGAIATPGAGPPIPDVAASFPGGSSGSDDTVSQATSGDIFRLWRDHARALGYRGRISDSSRKYWALAPTWTNQVDPVPRPPERSTLPAELVAAEPELVELVQSGEARSRQLASAALAELGCTDAAMRDVWIGWLSSDDVGLRRAGLVGLRTFGREVIEHQATIIALLEDRETMVAAAQLLTAIATPAGWKAVAERASRFEERTPYAMLVTMAHYDAEALRPFLPKMTDEYRHGGYMMAALLIRFGEEAAPILATELGASLADRRMVAAEALGHLGSAGAVALPVLKKMGERHPIAQKLLDDAIKRIEGQ